MDLKERQKFTDLVLSGRGQTEPTLVILSNAMCEKSLRQYFIIASEGGTESIQMADAMAAVDMARSRGDCPENNPNMASLYEALEDFGPFEKEVHREEAMLGNKLKPATKEGNVTFLGRGRTSTFEMR